MRISRRAVSVVAMVAMVLGIVVATNNGSPSIKAKLADVVTNTWIPVTPSGVDMTHDLSCGNFGPTSMVADPARPSNLYTAFPCQGIWRSTDFGQTWQGPINTGTNGAMVGDCAGNIAVATGGTTANPAVLYQSCIRGAGTGFERSTDGGVNWTVYNIAPGGSRQDFGPPQVDPRNGQHIVMAGHEQNLLVESTNGGVTWSFIPMDPGMNQSGGTAKVFFIDTGNATTTASTLLWLAQGTGGGIGTWRTVDKAHWTHVDKAESVHGTMQIFQPDTSGLLLMAEIYSDEGWGVLRSTDFGQTWAHVGNSGGYSVVFGTPNHVYADYSWACGLTCTVDPFIQHAGATGLDPWVTPATQGNMAQGPAQAATVFDGTHWVILSANWGSGLFRYVESETSGPPPTTVPPTTAPPTTVAPTTVPPTTTPPTTTAPPAAATKLTCPVVANPTVGQQITCTYA